VAEQIAGWWSWIAPATLQATLLLGAAWVVDRTLRNRAWPQTMVTVWLVALARLLLPPTLESPWSVTSSIGGPTLRAVASSASDARLASFAAIWSVGAILCLAARRHRRRILERRVVELQPKKHADWESAVRAAARSMRLERGPRLGTLAGLATPAVSGWLRPILLLPPAFLDRTPTRHDHNALLHELAHVRRGDLRLDEAIEVLRALFWFHPLVWLASARIRAWSEVACDATVARRLGGRTGEYRETLVLAARDALGFRRPTGIRAFAGARSAILARVDRLDRLPCAPLAAVRAASAALALALFACVLPMAPGASMLRASAQRVLDAQLRGERQSCFSVHAAAMVLAADLPESSSSPGL
jgi:beta-lactamase regulating signal transducer with metallopeptidase domain